VKNAHYDVAVVGAGIVGAACAMELAARALRVVIIEGQTIAAGATGAGMGHIVVMDDSEAQFALTKYSQQIWQNLRSELPDDVGYQECGTIWIAADDEEMAEVRHKHDFYPQSGIATQILDAQLLAELEPNLRRGLAGGLLVPRDAVLNAPFATRFFVERARQKGAELHLGLPVTKIGKQRVHFANGSELAAGVIVSACGAWAPELTPGIDIKKRKGHLVIAARHPGFVRHQLVELGYLKSAHSIAADSVAFNIQPRRNGELLIGSSRQFGAEHKEIDPAIVTRMMQRAQEYMPGLASLSTVSTRTGFRAATPDKLPLIGPWPKDEEDKSVFLATGHEGLGITTSTGTARLLADQITGKKPEIPIEPYLPSRMTAKS
jgi:D-hydroxyproline dehydrogenase subunit beta